MRSKKKLSIPAIKGYRSALGQVFYYRGIDISNSPEISCLIKNFEQELPKTNSLVPKWDLNLVLHSLLGKPYEPLSLATMQNLSLKTVFLLALASAKRISEIHGLSHVVSHTKHWHSVTLTFAQDFIAKTQIPGKSDTAYGPIIIPSLSQILGKGDPDNLLCPVRALKEYIRRTQGSRPSCDRLFITSHSRNQHCVSKNTISFWIRKVIKRAYTEVSDDQASLHRIKPHELRAMATSLAFSHNSSLSQVMAAASWRCHTTFVSHYLRDVSHKFMDVFSLGPLVAGQHLIQPPSSS